MNDDLFIPKHIANLLLDDMIPWEVAESIATLLTLTQFRNPIENDGEYSTYVFKRKEVTGRVHLPVDWGQYPFVFRHREIPLISHFQAHKEHHFSYKVHELAHPKNYKRRHLRLEPFGVYPVDLWKLPRHIWIRWRYSSRIPIHKTLFSKSFLLPEFSIPLAPLTSFSEAISTFKMIDKSFKTMMMACDVSTTSYSFLCYVYFYLHDRLISCLRKQEVRPAFFELLRKFNRCVTKACCLDMPGVIRVFKCEGWVRAIVPNGFFNTYPYSLFSAKNFTSKNTKNRFF